MSKSQTRFFDQWESDMNPSKPSGDWIIRDMQILMDVLDLEKNVFRLSRGGAVTATK